MLSNVNRFMNDALKIGLQALRRLRVVCTGSICLDTGLELY